MSNYVLPGYYKLSSATITNYLGKQLDIMPMLPSFSITESIANDSIRGILNVYDTVGILEDFPLRGEEKLTIEVEDPLENKQEYKLFVYKIDNVKVKASNDGLTYDMHFVSEARWNAGTRRIIRSYEKTISYIVKEIFNATYLGAADKGIQIEETDGIFRCVIPNYTPIQAMDFLSSRAYTETSPSCSFRFFETNEKFWFVSDEYLIKSAVETDNVKEFTFSDAIDKSGAQFMDQMKNLSAFENATRANSIMDLYSGAYTNNVIEIDIVKKKLTNKHYVYTQERDKYVKVDVKGNGTDVHTDNFINAAFTEENERRFLVVKDYTSIDDIPGQLRGEQYLPQIVSNRLAYRHHLNNTSVYAKCYGRLDLHAGQVINLKVPEFTSTSSDKKLNPQLTGNYILHDVIHNFNEDLFETTMKLVKYDWST